MMYPPLDAKKTIAGFNLEKLRIHKKDKAFNIPIIFPGNRKISADQLNRRASGHKTNKAEANTSRECIEIDDDIEEIENRDNNVSKSRKTTKQNSRVAQKTPRKEVKTPRKAPRKEVKTPRTTPRKEVKTPRTTPRKEVKTPRTTPRKELKTPRKTPQKGRHIVLIEPRQMKFRVKCM
jgi:hypothetical protein